jgi:glycosyltransferase involved in cell wall biosynthesis
MRLGVRIAIDATPVLRNKKGIGVVLDGLISSAAKDSLLASALVLVDESFADDAAREWPGRNLRPVKVRSSLVWETTDLPALVSREKIDILLTTRDRTSVSGRARTLVWLFEVPDHRVALLLKSRAPLFRKLVARASLWRFRRIARRVSHFVVSSEFTRCDLVERYGIPSSRITLIAPGVSDAYREAPAKRETSYVLHFATGDPRDNSELAMRVFARVTRGTSRSVRLLLAGVPDPLRSSLEEKAQKLGIARQTDVRGYVPDPEMPELFASAAVYFDPTIFEGFGLQLLEAMAAGAPVITSNNSSAAEVVGDAGMVAPFNDEDAFASALTALLTDERLRAEYISRGRARSASYTWTAAASQFQELLLSLA